MSSDAALNGQILQLLVLLSAIFHTVRSSASHSNNRPSSSDTVPITAESNRSIPLTAHSPPIQSPPSQSLPVQPLLQSPQVQSLSSSRVQSPFPDVVNTPIPDPSSPASEPGPEPASGPIPPASQDVDNSTFLNVSRSASPCASTKSRPPAPTLRPPWERFGVCSGGKGPFRVTITPHQIGTRWKGWGTSLAWLGNYIGGFPQAAMDPLLDLMFLPSGLNLNIVRFNIGGGSVPQYSPQLYTDSSMRWRAMPGYWPAQAAGLNWTADSRQQAVLLGAKARGVNVFEAFSNSPPWWMTASKDVSGAKKKWRTNLLRRFEGKFAKYLVKVVEGFAKNPALGKIEFDTLEPFNEGLEGQWVAGMEQEGCNFNPPEMNRVLLKTWLALRKRKLKTKLVGVDSNAALTSLGLPLVLRKTLLHRISVHGYTLPPEKYVNLTTAQAISLTTVINTQMKRLARSLGKEVWVSESGPLFKQGNDYDLSLYMMRNIIESVNILEASAFVYWQIYDGSDNWSVIKINWEHPPGYTGPFDPPLLLKRFWMLKQFTDLVRPGSRPLVVPSKCQHTVAAFYSKEKRTVSALIVIQRAEDARFVVRLSGFKLNAGGQSEANIRRTTWGDDNVVTTTKLSSKDGVDLVVEGQSFLSVTFTHVQMKR